MENQNTASALPKFFYAFVLKIPPKYRDQNKGVDFDDELDLSALPHNVGKDFETFLFIHTDEETHLTFLLYTDITVIGELKCFFSKSSLSAMDIIVKKVNDFLLNGEFLSLEFWKEFNQELKDDWPLDQNQKELYENFIKEHTTVQNIIDKLNNLGMENLHPIELEILKLNQVSL
ncbi:hypothetical protein [Psychroflexus tropicus]|uniref:hypothetical protein n=1 Tax=Psychroflexus tropicus TaxID=197345 RepID=UPI0003AA4B7C|nr:hypothetical protein [Psychroflexus tropicus]